MNPATTQPETFPRTHLALSVVAPAGNWIRDGKKTLEVRRWQPEILPLRDLVIIQNNTRLSQSGIREDPDGRAVALVDVHTIGSWEEHQIAEAAASYWEPGWLAWHLSNVRPLHLEAPIPACLRLYTIHLPETPT